MQKILLPVVIMLLVLNLPAQKTLDKTCIGLIGLPGSLKEDPEFNAAVDYMETRDSVIFDVLSGEKILSEDQLLQYDIIWLHSSDTSLNEFPGEFSAIIRDYVNHGGNLLLSLEAMRFIQKIGIDDAVPEVRNKKAEDSGFGRKLGLHTFRSHPVFAGLNGGSYILKPQSDTTVRIIGYFGDNVPETGKVVAVDWDYIFLRENSKLMAEWTIGKGKVLGIGAYTILSQPNKNRAHLEKFLDNCFHYLAGKQTEIKNRYWSYEPQSVSETEPPASTPVDLQIYKWPEFEEKSVLRRKSSDQFWDVAGERMLVMGHEDGGIDEIWAHPFMAVNDYKTSMIISDSLLFLKDLQPDIEVRPESFTRIYRTGTFILREVIVAAKTEPSVVVHYEFSGPPKTLMMVDFTSNLRFMWPYSDKVLKKMVYAYDTNLNAMIFGTSEGEFNCMVGSNKKMKNHLLGQYESFIINKDSVSAPGTDKFMIRGLMQFSFAKKETLDIVISADHLNLNTCIDTYRNTLRNTATYYSQIKDIDPANSILSIQSPDAKFNEGYEWALRAADRFLVHTPGLGTSLVAGYGTTAKGWDGGHKINGRPGYAWYFGRDGEWSGFALLDYGDFPKVKEILKMYQQYQDLTGKIYHEVSTSGVVHYDASDATPLYIILAGKYLRHSGDLAFIDSSWNNIRHAIDFCFSTDTDDDHLIENTNVGHGWVEGGALFGSHSSLYLTACWAQALEEAAYMAKALNVDSAKFYHDEAETVRQIINKDFWQENEHFLSHGKYKNGTYFTEHSIMPAIPMYFNQVDSRKAALMLRVIASDDYSSDWGCRIISKSSKLFNPRGYHTGSVWPLYTGWIALAEYNNGSPVQGFTHIMNNLQVYDDWGLGFVEEVLHGRIYKPSGVCHHQCWSETMVLQPAIEGMLGLETDALSGSLKLSPAFPPQWDSVFVKRIRMGSHLLDFKMTKSENQIVYQFNHCGNQPLKLSFNQVFEPGTTITEITAGGPFESKRLSPDQPVSIYIDDRVALTYRVKGGIGIIPVTFNPQPGDTSSGIRILNESLENMIYTVQTEAIGKSSQLLSFYIRDWEIEQVENGEIIDSHGNIYTLKLPETENNSGYVLKSVTIKLKYRDEN